MISFVEYLHLLRHAAETTCSGNNTHFLAAAAGIQVVGNFCCCIAWLGLRGNSCKQTRRSLRRVVGFFFTGFILTGHQPELGVAAKLRLGFGVDLNSASSVDLNSASSVVLNLPTTPRHE
jgi:hypothetical protein